MVKIYYKHLKNSQHVSVYDHHQGVTMSLPKLLLHEPSCMFANRGGVAAYHVIWISLCLRSGPGVRIPASVVDDSLMMVADRNMLEFFRCF
jgi:hypothetical protein